MLEQVLRYCKRFRYNDEFVKSITRGTFVIDGGGIAPPVVADGLHYAIYGSDFNDGVHAPGDELTDEVFTGSVWMLRLPKAFLALVSEMEAWQEKNGDAAASPYSSESFGSYSRSKSTNLETGSAVTVWSAFSERLNQWRKI